MEQCEYEHKQIPLERLSCDYFNLINDFYQWFGDKQQEIHGEAIKEAVSEHNELQKDLMVTADTLIKEGNTASQN